MKNSVDTLIEQAKSYNLMKLIQEVSNQITRREPGTILPYKSALEIKTLLSMIESCLIDTMDSFVVTASGEKRFVQPKNKKFSLEELQEIVEGYIEIISLPNLKKKIVLNEEGKINNLAVNHYATYLFRDSYNVNDYIAGTVLICDSSLL